MLEACKLIAEMTANPRLARRGRRSIRGMIKKALFEGNQKVILVSGREEMRASVIKIKGSGDDYAWQSTYSIKLKAGKLQFLGGDSRDAKARFAKDAED